jgi:N-formylglutamate amidohydrolase
LISSLMSRRTALSGMAVLAAVPARAQGDADAYLLVQRGDAPVILSAPHGGREVIPGVADRRVGSSSFRVATVRDENTLELAQALASALAGRIGGAPHLVAARFARINIDANRPAREAFTPPGDGGAREIYGRYHDALAVAHAEVRRRFGRGLLIDIHGQNMAYGTLFRGTANGTTVRSLLARNGSAGLTGPNSVFGVMAAKGYAVHPAIGSNEREQPEYSGGFIVRTYGGGAIDAIQLEFGANARSSNALSRTASDLADAIAAHVKAFVIGR